jgi:hypothetical protein
MAAYALLAQTPAAGTFHDDGIYLVTAKALAEGHGYRIISLPGDPRQTKYPVLFPWALSLVWRVHPSFPQNLPWLRLVPLMATFSWLCVTWLLLRRLGARQSEAAVVVLLTAASPWVAFFSTSLMTETMFAALITGALLMITRVHQGEDERFGALSAGILAGAAILTRVAGIAPAAGGILAFIVARRWKAAMTCAGATFVTILPWLLWTSQQSQSATDLYYQGGVYASWNIVTQYAWPEKLAVLTGNLFLGGLALMQMWVPRTPYAFLNVLVAGIAIVLVGTGAWKLRREPFVLVVAAYAALHLAWVWPPVRFVVPIVPLLLWLVFAGSGRRRWLAAGAAAALFLAGTLHLAAAVAPAHDRGDAWPFPDPDEWDQTERLLAWTSKETPPDAVLTGVLDPAYYLFTGRKSVRAFNADPYLLYYNMGRRLDNPLGTVPEFRDRLLNVHADYVILTLARGFGEAPHLRELVSELARSCTGSLTPVAHGRDAEHQVYAIDRERLASAECSAIRSVQRGPA